MTLDPRTAAADELLQALTVGELTPEDPLVAARLAQDPALQARWHALAKTLADLRELDAGMRGDGAVDVAPVDTTRMVRAFRGRTFRTWLGVGALAAAILLMVWLLRPEPGPPPNPQLGGERTIVGLTPADGERWQANTPLSWKPLPRARGYRLYVESLRDGTAVVLPDGENGELIVGISWLPTEAKRADLPAEFRWCVVAFDVSGVEIARSKWVTPQQ